MNTWSGSSPSAVAASSPKLRTAGSWCVLVDGERRCRPPRASARQGSRQHSTRLRARCTLAGCASPPNRHCGRRTTRSPPRSASASPRPTPWASSTTAATSRTSRRPASPTSGTIGHPYTELRENGLDSAVLEVYVRYRQAAALRRRGRRPPAAGVGQPHDVPDGLPADARRRGHGHRGHRARRPSPPPAARPACRPGWPRWARRDALVHGRPPLRPRQHHPLLRPAVRRRAGDGRAASSTAGTTWSPPTTRCGCSATWRWARSTHSLAPIGRARRHQAARARQPRPLLARSRRPGPRGGPSATSPPGSPRCSTSRSS